MLLCSSDNGVLFVCCVMFERFMLRTEKSNVCFLFSVFFEATYCFVSAWYGLISAVCRCGAKTSFSVGA